MHDKPNFHFFVWTLFYATTCFACFNHPLYGEKTAPIPTLSIGGGYIDGNSRHSGGLLQIEYKWGSYLWHCWRPQITFIMPRFRSCFLGFGLGFECKLSEKITVAPSFTPGLYFKGRGQNLGYPLEFRSAIELAYKLHHNATLGFQAYHISNAHLGSKNPGMNAYVLFCAFRMP